MTTIGYGDIIPRASLEIIYVIFVSILSAGIFGYAMGVINGIFQEINI